MIADQSPSTALVCEVVAEPRLAAVLASIVRTCAADMQQRVAIRARTVKEAGPASITVHLPIDVFVESAAAWRLAFRVACFCPHARVSVLAQMADSARNAAADRAA